VKREQSETERQIRSMEATVARDMLERHPITQAEKIALHYVSNIAMAWQLYKIVRMRKYASPEIRDDPSTISAMEYMVRSIKDQHLQDFGSELIVSQKNLNFFNR
jgi:hypothetical protein